MFAPPLWMQGSLGQAVARTAGAAAPANTDTGSHRPGLPPLGKDAAVVLQDSLATLPQRAEQWVTATVGAIVRLLPRLALAFLAAAAVIGFTIWVRRELLRREGASDTGHRSRIGLSGLLTAGTVAAAIVGASTVAAALLIFLVFQAGATVVQLIGQRVFRRSPHPPADAGRGPWS